MASLRRENGSFLIEVDRGEKFTVLTVIGRKNEEASPPNSECVVIRGSHPDKNVSSIQICTWLGRKPAPWRAEVVGDKIDAYEGGAMLLCFR